MIELNTVYKAFLELVKIGIGTSKNDFDFSVLSDDDWLEILSESKKQASILICFEALKNIKSKPAENIYNNWFLLAAAIIKNNVKVINGQVRLIKLLNENDIPYTILKGTASSNYYLDGNLRSLGDVDFIVHQNRVEEVRQLLLNNEYVLHSDINPIHYEFKNDYARFELHKKIAGIPENKYGVYFENELNSILESSNVLNGFSNPCDYHHGIVIFLHTIHHILSNGIGIRHLCDWACFVNKTHKEAFWTEKFIPLLKKTGMFNFACGLTLTAVKLLDIEKPEWCISVTNEMVRTLIFEIGSSGNFGRKKEKKYSLIMTRKDSEKSSVFSKISGMIKALNKTNHIVCPIITKIPIIYPFVMIYRMLKYLILMCFGKRPSLLETSRYADERSSVYMKYQLYKVEEQNNE